MTAYLAMAGTSALAGVSFSAVSSVVSLVQSVKALSVSDHVKKEVQDLDIDATVSTLELVVKTHQNGGEDFKLAREYYGDPTLWWVIAHFNKMPTEGHVELGDMIYIPLPVGRVVRMLEG